jgi:hypothetical protein
MVQQTPAGVAQLAAHRSCKAVVRGSSPLTGSHHLRACLIRHAFAGELNLSHACYAAAPTSRPLRALPPTRPSLRAAARTLRAAARHQPAQVSVQPKTTVGHAECGPLRPWVGCVPAGHTPTPRAVVSALPDHRPTLKAATYGLTQQSGPGDRRWTSGPRASGRSESPA